MKFFSLSPFESTLTMTCQNCLPIRGLSWRHFRAQKFGGFSVLFFVYFDFFSDIKRVHYPVGSSEHSDLSRVSPLEAASSSCTIQTSISGNGSSQTMILISSANNINNNNNNTNSVSNNSSSLVVMQQGYTRYTYRYSTLLGNLTDEAIA